VDNPRVLIGYVFGSIFTLGGLATALFVDKSQVSSTGVTGFLGIPIWIMGLLIAAAGIVILWRSVLLHRKS